MQSKVNGVECIFYKQIIPLVHYSLLFELFILYGQYLTYVSEIEFFYSISILILFYSIPILILFYSIKCFAFQVFIEI